MKVAVCGLICSLLFSLGVSASVAADELSPWSTKETTLRVTYEEIDLPSGENVGLAGGNYLVPVTPWLKGGIGVYGAVSGQRGGFFTGGAEVSLQYPVVGSVSLGGGLFVGGGGGGAAPQGGGLMLRPHGELLVDVGAATLGLGISHVRFPNGDISSTQAFVTCEVPLDARFAGGWTEIRPRVPGGASAAGGRRYLVSYGHLFSEADARTTDGRRGDRSLGLVGAELQQSIGGGTHLRVAAAGAAAGNADGYAQVLLGGGVDVPLSAGVTLTADLSLGAGGGGKVDTGGGLLVDGQLGFRYQLRKGWALGLSAGYLAAPDGSFRAPHLDAILSYGPSTAKDDADPVVIGHWRVRGGVQRYFPSASMRKSGSGDNEAIDLAVVKIDRFLQNGLYGTGQALAACDGNAGGYAAGLLGGGWMVPLGSESPLFGMAELLLGAGGGGGVDSGGGFLLQPMMGVGWRLSGQFDLLLSGGYVWAPDGGLTSAVADLSLAWRFSTLESR